MNPTVIATWPFARDAVPAGGAVLARGGKAPDAVVDTITVIENDPEIDTVGYGGLPNLKGEVQCDAAMMMGDTLRMGAVMGLINYKSPIRVARGLINAERNNVLCGQGADDFAAENGFEPRDMLTEKAKLRLDAALAAGVKKPVGHDTVGCLALDGDGLMVAGVSTSGLGFKHRGRVGDSPLVGSGFYVDNEIGGAAATGVGEDIMKGCVCYAAVEAMRSGLTPQAALEKVIRLFLDRMKRGGDECGNFAMIALDKDGNFGGSCCCEFEYSVWQGGKVMTFTPEILR